jgi:hypothetical protein
MRRTQDTQGIALWPQYQALRNLRESELRTVEERVGSNRKLSEISGSHGGEYEDVCLLGFFYRGVW